MKIIFVANTYAGPVACPHGVLCGGHGVRGPRGKCKVVPMRVLKS